MGIIGKLWCWFNQHTWHTSKIEITEETIFCDTPIQYRYCIYCGKAQDRLIFDYWGDIE